MSQVDGKPHSSTPRASPDGAALRLVAAIDGLFPPGTPVPGAAFLDGVAQALSADQAALVLARMSAEHRVLRVVDDLLRKVPHHRERSFTEGVNDHAAWTRDPVARRLHDRCRKRPATHFTYTTRRLARGLDKKKSFSVAFLEDMGVRHEVTSLLPVGDNLFSLLTLYRIDGATSPFARSERRLLKLIHRTFASRVVDLRIASIRDALPLTLRATFALLLAGHTEKEIARQTHRSSNTIHDHVKRIYQHFGVTSRPQLMARFIDVDRVLQAMPTNGHARINADEA